MARTLESVLQTAKGLQARWYRDDWSWRSRRLSIQGEKLLRTHRHPFSSQLDDAGTVLIYKPDDIGDAVHSLPALAHLRRHWPNKKIHVLCQPVTEPIYRRSGLVDRIITVPVRKVALRFPVLNVSSLSLPHYDVAVYLRTYPAFLKQFQQISADLKVVPWEPRLEVSKAALAPVHLFPGNRRHQAEILLEMAGFLTGKFWTERTWDYPPPHWEAQDQEKTPALPYVVIHPFARFETRQYPFEQWTEWVRWLVQTLDLPVYVVGGKEDPPYDAEGLAIPLQGKLSLGQTGHFVSQAKCFVGTESGPAHWAGALGVPTIVFFGGHSDPVEWAVKGNVLRLFEPVPCGPCHRRYCPGFGVKCLKQLTLENWKKEAESFVRQNIPEVFHGRSSGPVVVQGTDGNRPPHDSPPPSNGT